MIKNHVNKARFDNVSLSYDQYASVQHTAGHYLINKLNHTYQRVLDLGCGTGTFTNCLNSTIKNSSIIGIDSSPQMIHYCKRLYSTSKMSFLQSNLEQDILPKSNLIVSNGCFQWINNKTSLFKNCYESLDPNGDLVFSVFGPKTFYELQETIKKSIPTPLHLPASSFSDIKHYIENLEKHRFNIQSVDKQTYYIPYTSLLNFLKHIKYTGTNSKNQKIWTRKKLQKIESTFKSLYGTIFASYETYFIKAKK